MAAKLGERIRRIREFLESWAAYVPVNVVFLQSCPSLQAAVYRAVSVWLIGSIHSESCLVEHWTQFSALAVKKTRHWGSGFCLSSKQQLIRKKTDAFRRRLTTLVHKCVCMYVLRVRRKKLFWKCKTQLVNNLRHASKWTCANPWPDRLTRAWRVFS